MKKLLFLTIFPLLLSGCATYVDPFDENAVFSKMSAGSDKLQDIDFYVGPEYLLVPESSLVKDLASLRAFTKNGRVVYEAVAITHAPIKLFAGHYDKAILDSKKEIMPSQPEREPTCYRRGYEQICLQKITTVIPVELNDLLDHQQSSLSIRLQGQDIKSMQNVIVPYPYIRAFLKFVPHLQNTEELSASDEQNFRRLAGLQGIIVVGKAELDTSFLDKMVKGKTTIDEARQHFGKPFRIDNDKTGRSLYQWISFKHVGFNTNKKHIAVVFDKNGKFEYIKLREDE